MAVAGVVAGSALSSAIAAALALGIGAGVAFSAGAAGRQGPVRPSSWVPTRPEFALSHDDTSDRLIAHGDLICKGAELDDCRVARMPMLWQMNPALKAPLEAYAARYVIKSGPHAGTIAWAEPQLGSAETWYTVSDFANQIMAAGCYVTSLTTLESAALSDMPVRLAPGARTATFNDVAPDSLLPGGKPLNQLEWQYRRWADKLQPNRKDPSQPSSPDFLEFPEFAADFPTSMGETQDYPNPTHLTNAVLVEGMKQGRTYLFAYQRFNVTLSPPNKRGVVRVTMTFDSQHKVAVSGFQPGNYPLLIDDVGAGRRYRVRLTSDATSIPFKNGSAIIPPTQLKIMPPPGVTSPIYVVYEGADGVIAGAGDQLFILVDYASLSVGHRRARPHANHAPALASGADGGGFQSD